MSVAVRRKAFLFLFFFSSRRRHTRWPRDWSSDVCSSDLLRASDTEKSQQDVGHQRGAQAVERGTQAFVNLLGGGQQSTGHQRRNGQQNSSPRQVLCRSKQRLRVVESSQGGQQTIQGTVQRVRIEAQIGRAHV